MHAGLLEWPTGTTDLSMLQHSHTDEEAAKPGNPGG